MENTSQLFPIGRQHLEQFGIGIAAMDHHGQIMLQGPLYLYVQGFLLFFFVGLVPIQVHTDLTYRDEGMSRQVFLHGEEPLFELCIHTFRVESQHRIAIPRIIGTHFQYSIQRSLIFVGKEDLLNTRCLGTGYHLWPVSIERLVV